MIRGTRYITLASHKIFGIYESAIVYHARKVWKYRRSLSIAIVRRKTGTRSRADSGEEPGRRESPLPRFPRDSRHGLPETLSVFFYLLKADEAFFRTRRDERYEHERDNECNTADRFQWIVRFYT